MKSCMHKAILALNIQKERVKVATLKAVALYRFYKAWEKCEVSTVQRFYSEDRWYVAFLKWNKGSNEVWPDDAELRIEDRRTNKVIVEGITFDEARAECIAEVLDA